MTGRLVLASSSAVRQQLLRAAGVDFDVRPARIDEEAVRDALQADGVGARDQADALAELKALRVSGLAEGSLVLGCDQVLEQDGRILSKPTSRAEAKAQLQALGGVRHHLHAAAVIAEAGRPVWRHVETVRMTMRPLSADYVEAYLGRNWPEIGASVGGYMVEKEGVRLFSRMDGDWFAILGLPLIPILTYLADRGLLET